MGTVIVLVILFIFIGAYFQIIGAILLGILAMITGESFFIGIAIMIITYLIIGKVKRKQKL